MHMDLLFFTFSFFLFLFLGLLRSAIRKAYEVGQSVPDRHLAVNGRIILTHVRVNVQAKDVDQVVKWDVPILISALGVIGCMAHKLNPKNKELGQGLTFRKWADLGLK